MTIRPQRFATAWSLAPACAAAGGAVALFVAAAIAAAGGGVANLRVATVGFRAPWTALGAGMVLTLAAAWLRRRNALPHTSRSTPVQPYRRAAVAVALCAGTAAWAYGTESAAGADASGYLNAARLFAAGTTSVSQPLAAGAPWPDALQTMAPLGFRVGDHHRQPGGDDRPTLRLVPTYPPGLPLAYAVAMQVHPRAWTIVVPLLAAAVVFGTFVVGLRFVSAPAALLAACGVAASPVFLFHAVQPMSDVPATASWVLAVALALHGTPRSGAASGLAAGAAILTRPNLAPLAAAVAAVLWLSARCTAAASATKTSTPAEAVNGHGPFNPPSAVDARDTLRSFDPASRRIARWAVIAYLVAVMPGVLAVGWLNTILYGHPLASGYGSAADLFSVSFVATNAARYGGWLADVHPAATIGAVAAALLFASGWRVAQTAGRGDGGHRPAVFALAGFVALNVGAYLVYAPFENWTYLRFLLPSFPLAAIAAASAVDRALVYFPRVAIPTLAAVLCGLVVGLGIRDASTRGVFDRRTVDARHELIADAYRTEAASRVFVTQQHSGAVLFHTGAPVLRWDLIDPAALDAALAWFATRGLAPVILVDAEEEPVFRSRFAGRGAWAGLDWPARFETAPPQRARAYELPDRARFEAGDRWSPRLLRRRP